MFDYLKQHDRLRLEALSEQLCVGGSLELARTIDARGELLAFANGEEIIEQGASTNDVFFILAGHCDVVVNGRVIGKRGPRLHIGEMAAIQPTQVRSASCIAAEPM